jgi:3-deoxy-D-manno-octulosonic-acid transferase
VQLLCAPRKPEWFDRAADELPGCVRRSGRGGPARAGSDRFLLDSIGELRRAYACADIVVIGRTFGNLHGSDMMEPAALGRCVVTGPRTDDFAATAEALRGGGGIVDATRESLASVLSSLAGDPRRRASLGESARAVVRAHQGATARTVALADRVIASSRARAQERLA